MPATCGLVKFRFLVSGDPDEQICTLGVRYWGELTPPLPWDTLAANLSYTWKQAFPVGIMSTSLSYVGLEVIVGNADQPPEEKQVYDENPDHVGTQSFSPPPVNCCAVVRKKTAKIGKKHRGRFYLPNGFMNEAHISGLGEISNTTLTNLQTAATNLESGLRDADLIGCIFHEATSALGPQPTDVTSYEVATMIGTQRRRLG